MSGRLLLVAKAERMEWEQAAVLGRPTLARDAHSRPVVVLACPYGYDRSVIAPAQEASATGSRGTP